MTSSGGVNGMIDPYEGSDMVVEYRAEMCCDPTMHYWPLQRWGMTGTEQTTTDGARGSRSHTQVSLPTPMASKLFPLRVRLSWRMGTTSRLISFSDGGGEPSTHPFHPFLTATLFFLGGGCGGGGETTNGSSRGPSS